MKYTIVFFFALITNCFGQKQFEVFFDFNQDFPNQQSILDFNQWIIQNIWPLKSKQQYQSQEQGNDADGFKFGQKNSLEPIFSILSY